MLSSPKCNFTNSHLTGSLISEFIDKKGFSIQVLSNIITTILASGGTK
ncbi:hypothetical protein HOF65_03140 [bacterium]|nr:hypothetical protein [bacterium]MBT3852988.1 hypothetical protein [bacterium]MBT4633116.1 hypothetical protein [bacterium]MBT5492304.1 hypothetical protein [bacterium]MBT6779066.1 hypothetical protein [bacterium]